MRTSLLVRVLCPILALLGGACVLPTADEVDEQQAARDDALLGSTEQALEGTVQAYTRVLSDGSNVPANTYSTALAGVTTFRVRTGVYWVQFDNLAGTGCNTPCAGGQGNVQAVAYGPGNARCKVHAAQAGEGDKIMSVYCHDSSGQPVDSGFTVKYERKTSNSARGAYLWANIPFRDSYTPEPTYSWNSSGGTNTIQRSSTGVYHVTLPGLMVVGGTVQVTAVGRESEYCKVRGWGVNGAGQLVTVTCFSSQGDPTDSEFSLLYGGPAAAGYRGLGAYAWANDSTSASYTPLAKWSFNAGMPCPTNNQAERYGVGDYGMKHPELPTGRSHAHVTAYGADASYCKLLSMTTAGTPRVRTKCFKPDGQVVDSRYVETYVVPDAPGICVL